MWQKNWKIKTRKFFGKERSVLAIADVQLFIDNRGTLVGISRSLKKCFYSD
jgi:hypothetical protein